MVKVFRDYLTISIEGETYTDTSTFYLSEKEEEGVWDEKVSWKEMNEIDRLSHYFDFPFFVRKDKKGNWMVQENEKCIWKWLFRDFNTIAKENKNPDFTISYQVETKEVTDFSLENIWLYGNGELAAKFFAERNLTFSKNY